MVAGRSAASAPAGQEPGPRLQHTLTAGQVFALQFAVICVLGNVLGGMPWGLTTAGPAFVWEWVLGGLLQISVALSLAELSSAYPLTGACYSWLREMSHRSLALIAGFLLLFGYVAALADNDSGLATALFGFAGVANPTATKVALTAVLCLAAQAALSLASLRLAVRTVALAVAVQIICMVSLAVALVVVGLRHGPDILLTTTHVAVHEHLPPVLLMLMIPVWTITGLDAAGNFAGETRAPGSNGPRGLLAAAGTSFLCGTVLFVVPLFAMTSLHQATAASSSLLFIVHARLGSDAAIALDAIVISALFFLPVVLQMVAGRLLWVQARDGIWPRAQWLAVRSVRGVPVRATLACVMIAGAFCVLWPGLYGLGTVWPALWPLAYAITIAVGVRAKLTARMPEERRWNLGRWGIVNDLVAIVWSVFLVVLMPLFDAFHAIPLFALIVLAGVLASFLWSRPGSDTSHAPGTLPAERSYHP